MIVNINMIHIAPWQAYPGAMTGAKRLLAHPRDFIFVKTIQAQR